MRSVEDVLNYISKNWPSWIEWYSLLPENHAKQLRTRIVREGKDFLKNGMWEYSDYADYCNKNRNSIYAQSVTAYENEDPSMRNAYVQHYSEQYGFDVYKKLNMKKDKK